MKHLKSNEFQQQQPIQYNYVEEEEEISLIDLWITIRRYKQRFFIVFAIVFIAGLLIFNYSNTKKYSLVSAIQIGNREKDNSIMPIESPESLLTKINNAIIPSYTNLWNQQNSSMGVIETKATNPKSSNIILITNNTNGKNIDLLSDYQRGLVQIIIDDQKKMVGSIRSVLESQLRLSQVELDNLNSPMTLESKLKTAQIYLDDQSIKLKKLEDERFFGVKKAEFQSQILQAKHEKKRLDDLEEGRLEEYNRIDKNKKILLEKINELKAQTADSTKNLRVAAATATEQSAMSQLLIANEIQQNQNQLAMLEERYHIKLENEKTELKQQIEDIRLQKIESVKKIDLLAEKYKVLLEDNQMLRDQQKLKVSEAKLNLEEIKHKHKIATTMQEEKVREIKSRLDNFSETRAVSTAVKSLRPIGASRLQLIFLAFIVAVFVGFAAVLFAIFGDKVKERLEAENAA